jgi:hypothetical protein
MGIIMIMAYLILFSVLMLYGIVKFWPSPLPLTDKQSLQAPERPEIESEEMSKEANKPDSESVKLVGPRTSIPNEEVRLFLIVAMAGALGSLVHAFRSLYWYVGYRALVRSWLPKYILLPFVGATLGLVFYFVIRGGFFSPQATSEQISPYGFAAVAGLIGMFSEQAAEKLKQVATTLFAETPKGEDQAPPKEEKPEAEAKPQGKPTPETEEKPQEKE